MAQVCEGPIQTCLGNQNESADDCLRLCSSTRTRRLRSVVLRASLHVLT